MPDRDVIYGEMHRLERRMYELDWRDPERAKIVAQYNAVCDELGIPSGDKDDVLDIPYDSGDLGVIVTAYVTCPECGQGFLAMADEEVTGCAQH